MGRDFDPHRRRGGGDRDYDRCLARRAMNLCALRTRVRLKVLPTGGTVELEIAHAGWRLGRLNSQRALTLLTLVTIALLIRSNYLSVGLRSEGNRASTAKAVAASDINMRGQESPSSPPCSRS